MLVKVYQDELGQTQKEHLHSYHHFSFGDYFNPKRIRFGALRTVNFHKLASETALDPHSYYNMEGLFYVINGDFSIKSHQHHPVLTKGDFYYFSSGKGLEQVISNDNLEEELNFLEILVFPNKQYQKAQSLSYPVDWHQRVNKVLPLISSQQQQAFGKINQDVTIYALHLDAGKELEFMIKERCMCYLVVLEGTVYLEEHAVSQQEAIEIYQEHFIISAKLESAHLILVETKQKVAWEE